MDVMIINGLLLAAYASAWGIVFYNLRRTGKHTHGHTGITNAASWSARYSWRIFETRP